MEERKSMPEWRRKERTFTISPVPSGEASEQTLITAPCWAEVEEVRYVPNGRLVFWNDEKVHLGRHISLNLRNSRSGVAPARQVMVAWEEDARNPSVVEAHDEFRMPVLAEGKTSELYKGDELYWQSRPIAEGDAGDPGGTLRVTFLMSLPKVELGKAAAEAPNWAALEETFAATPDEAREKLNRLVQTDPQRYGGRNYSIYSAVRLAENAFELGPRMRAGFVITEQIWSGIVEENYL